MIKKMVLLRLIAEWYDRTPADTLRRIRRAKMYRRYLKEAKP